MRILLTNDDGIYAPGLRALRSELKKLGDVIVVAPATEQSAVGHSITLLTPLLVQEVLDEDHQPMGWAVEGRPADCVKLALLELLPQPPDLVVSGLNAGSNAGINVLYSGTVAAAIEGAFFRCTSIAVSLEYTKPKPLDFPRGGRAGPPRDRADPRTQACRRYAVQRQHPQLRQGPGPRHPRGAAERRPLHRKLRPPHRPPRPRLLLEPPRLPLPRAAPRHRRDRSRGKLHHRHAAAVQPHPGAIAERNAELGLEAGITGSASELVGQTFLSA